MLKGQGESERLRSGYQMNRVWRSGRRCAGMRANQRPVMFDLPIITLDQTF